MNKGIYPLLLAQFLSAFADNAILFAVIAMVLKAQAPAGVYVSALQSVFLVAFVMLAPWVGPFADKQPKPRVLVIANIIKAVGVSIFLIDIEPLIVYGADIMPFVAYGIVGIGATVYSPAKYGILPELAGHDQLVKANSWIEGSTIFAIVLGSVVGAKVADSSIDAALFGIIGAYLISAIATLMLPALPARGVESGSALLHFKENMQGFFSTSRARFAVLGSSLFWATAATLRVILVAWAPLVLSLSTASDIAELTLFLAIGIVVGSAIVPRLIPIGQLGRARLAAYAMAVFIGVLAAVDTLWYARSVMFAIGLMGGIFIVPINAALQDIGHHGIGSGGAVAIQRFMENAAMLIAVGIYTYASAHDTGPVAALATLALLVFFATVLVSLKLPEQIDVSE